MPKRFKKVYIEISNVCNLQCSFCPEVERGKRFMEPALFQKVIEAVGPLTQEVCFHLMGEPLLHPEFEQYLDICGAAGVRVNLTTNGILLKEKRADTLLHPALNQVNFSLQSFEANFPERDNSEYLGRIFAFTERALRERPDLYINYRLWNQGAPEAQASNERMFEKIRQGLQVNFTNTSDVRRKKNVQLKGRLSLHFDTRFQWPHPHQPIRSTRGFCFGLTSHIGILADGTVVPCCLDKEGVINLGNCSSQPLETILQTSRARAMHSGFHKGILVEDLCQKCTFITRFDDKLQKMTPQKYSPLAH